MILLYVYIGLGSIAAGKRGGALEHHQGKGRSKGGSEDEVGGREGGIREEGGTESVRSKEG